MDKEKVDILVIGGGVIGFAIASELSSKFHGNLVLVERHSSFGMETSSRNSEVIHAGIYYQANSLRAKLCVKGKQLLYEFCQKEGVPFNNIGKLIVASNAKEEEILHQLKKKGIHNGVHDLKIITQKEIKSFCDSIQSEYALYSPSTGIVNSHELMRTLEYKVINNESVIAYNSEVVSINKNRDCFDVVVKNADNSEMILCTSIVINCAGLGSEKIAQMAGLNTDQLGYSLQYRKGEYYSINKAQSLPQNILVYPTPNAISLGLHTVVDTEGGVRLGPYSYNIKNVIDYSIDNRNQDHFTDFLKCFFPQLQEEPVFPQMAGISPGGHKDFIIKEESDNGLPGFINLIGIQSPGLTSSLAIAQHVRSII